MRVSWVGTHLPEFSRNRQLTDWLAATDVEVDQIRVPLWPADRVRAFTEGRWQLLARALLAYPVLLVKLLWAKRPDVYLVSYPGWFDMPLVKLAATLKRRPVVFDPFISLFDTAVSDRGLVNSTSLLARLTRAADRLALRAADVVIADCATQGRFFDELAGKKIRIEVLFVGADETVMYPRPDIQPEPHRVLFYGTYVPLQGAESIVRAAALLGGDVPVEIIMIGAGQERDRVEAVAGELGVHNIEFREPATLEELTEEIHRASVVLGVFGTSDKANRVIPHKVFEGVACGRPVVTADTDAIREGFEPDEVVAVPPGDSVALAEALQSLISDTDRMNAIGEAARKAFVERYSRGPQVDRLERILRSAVAG